MRGIYVWILSFSSNNFSFIFILLPFSLSHYFERWTMFNHKNLTGNWCSAKIQRIPYALSKEIVLDASLFCWSECYIPLLLSVLDYKQCIYPSNIWTFHWNMFRRHHYSAFQTAPQSAARKEFQSDRVNFFEWRISVWSVWQSLNYIVWYSPMVCDGV